jgi:hypothetical protein
MVMFGIHALSPWLSMVDTTRYAACVKDVQGHGMSTIISGHSPVIDGPRVAQAFDMIGRLAGTEPPPCPDQAVLDMMLAAMGGE